MVCNLAGLAMKVPLNILCMTELGMGAAGCAASTSVIAWCTGVLAWGWFARQPDCRDYGVFARLTRPRLRLIAELLRLGLPIGVTLLVDVTAFSFMALFVARLGPEVSAAHQIASNLTIMTFMIPLSIGQAALVLAGHALGAKDPHSARHASLVGIGAGMAIAACTSLVLWLTAEQLAGLYTADTEVRTLASGLIIIIACYHLADALQAIVVNILRGYKRTTFPMLVYAFSLWGVGLGGGYLLGLTELTGTAHGVAGFWWAATLGVLLVGVIVLAYLMVVARRMCDQAR
jgi:MATE family multidrug resistance protein